MDSPSVHNDNLHKLSKSFFQTLELEFNLLSIISPKDYLTTPKTIGEHIRKKRFDLGLYQEEVAKTIGVNESTICNWEHGTEPEIRHMPKIIKFLGYIPFECPDEEDVLGMLRYFKLVNGLSYRKLGRLMNKDPMQVRDWCSGRTKPCKRNIQGVVVFLSR
jgi:transcriptional regulator with XRE-family HTH domain